MTATFDDHFAPVAGQYADSRPTYPPELFDWLAGQCAAHDLAWDCGAGSGQASTGLAARFERVVATDASAAQVASALPRPRVEYRVAVAHESGLPERCVDLVVVAQALHWFDLDRFYREVARVSKPTGVIAVWSYGVLRVEGDEVDAIVQRFHRERAAPYWPPERYHVETGYRELPFPFERIDAPQFVLRAQWSLDRLAGYFRSWSAMARFRSAQGFDAVTGVHSELRTKWGPPGRLRTVEWPLALLVGRCAAGTFEARESG